MSRKIARAHTKIKSATPTAKTTRVVSRQRATSAKHTYSVMPDSGASHVVHDDRSSVVMSLLGLPKSKVHLLRDFIHRGLDISAFDRIAQEMALAPKDLAKATNIKIRTLARRKKTGRLHPDESDRLVRLALLFQQAIALFEGKTELAAQWFHSPKKGLGGATPLAFADTEVGAREVRDLIGRLEHGVFS